MVNLPCFPWFFTRMVKPWFSRKTMVLFPCFYHGKTMVFPCFLYQGSITRDFLVFSFIIIPCAFSSIIIPCALKDLLIKEKIDCIALENFSIF